jgi:hypothetical protein
MRKCFDRTLGAADLAFDRNFGQRSYITWSNHRTRECTTFTIIADPSYHNSQTMVKIALAGGSGDVASEIIEVLVATKKHDIVILSRNVSLQVLLHNKVR